MATDIALFYKDLQVGGVQRMMIALANVLAEQGLKVDLVVGEADAQARALKSPKVRLIVLHTRNRVQLGFRLMNYLRSTRPRNIYSADPNYNGIMLLAKLLSASRGRSIISERSDTEALFRGTPFGFFKISIMLSPLLYRLADEIVAVSKGTADSLARFARISREKISVVYNPAFRNDIEAMKLEDVALPWAETDRRNLVVSAGRLSKQKNFPLLLEAFAIARLTHPRLKLIIIGDGPERSRLERLIRDLDLAKAVWLAGSQQNPFKWFFHAGTFALSSDWEGFGNVIVEALACGCSVVATDCPSGPSEILNGGEYGYLSPMGDVKAFAACLNKAIAAPIEERLLMERASFFSAETAAKEYMKLMAL